MHPVVSLSKTDTNNNNSNNIRALKWQVVTIYEYLRTSISKAGAFKEKRKKNFLYVYMPRQSVAVE